MLKPYSGKPEDQSEPDHQHAAEPAGAIRSQA
jgi:hypothetical protein